jgi:hypothetical protein
MLLLHSTKRELYIYMLLDEGIWFEYQIDREMIRHDDNYFL